MTTPTSDNEGDLQPSASRLPGNRSELSQGTSTAQPDRMHDVNDLPEDMIAAGALYK